MLDRIRNRIGDDRRSGRARSSARRLLEHLGNRFRPARRLPKARGWNPADLHRPMGQLAPVVDRTHPTHRYRR